MLHYTYVILYLCIIECNVKIVKKKTILTNYMCNYDVIIIKVYNSRVIRECL